MIVMEIISNMDGKIIGALYTNASFQKSVEIKVCTVLNSDPKNPGTIIEKYRNLDSGMQEFFEENRTLLVDFINRSSITFEEFIPEAIICFYPSDNNRKQLLEYFNKKITSKYSNNREIDYSDKFYKKDSNKSIVSDILTKEDFELLCKREAPFKGLLIIDDAINEGKTLNILLDKLFEVALVDNDTTIKMACIYNRPKSMALKINPLDVVRKKL